MDVDTVIMDTGFYTYHKGDRVFLGLQIPFGVFAVGFDKADWIQWLREELLRCNPAQIPKVFED